MVNNNSSLARFQELNKEIYLVANDRSYSTQQILSYIHRHATQIFKGVRKRKHNEIRYRLCMALSWSFALANRFHINLSDTMWKLFPGCCPYCLSSPCSCKKRAKKRKQVPKKSKEQQPVALFQWQDMFANIYSNILQNSAIHLAEEVGEVSEAVRNYQATHDKEWLEKVIEELVDLITNIFGVANCLKIDIASSMTEYFTNGCPKCHEAPCDCRFITYDRPTYLRQKDL